MILASWLHNINPFLIEFPDFLILDGIRWYGTAYAAGFILGWLLMRALGKRNAILIPPKHALDAAISIAMGVIIGGRIGYAILYRPELLWTFTDAFPWWELLRLTDGGMASHGGIAGVIVACWWISRGFKARDGKRHGKVPLLHTLDVVAFLATPGLFFGRIANFINGELLGRVVAPAGQPGPWWAVRFPQEALQRWDELPRAQQDAIASAVGMPGRVDDITTGAAWNDFALNFQILLDRLHRGSDEAARILGPIISSRHPSQLYQAFAEGIVLGLALLLIWTKPRKPGVVGCWFLIIYGVLRVITEFWRLPDSHLTVQRIMGLSRGQWFSIVMVAIGLITLALVSRRHVEPIGGWRRRRLTRLAPNRDAQSP
jgi:phosphatidylglycerol:prolipoprotein diacylglycerol transferase